MNAQQGMKNIKLGIQSRIKKWKNLKTMKGKAKGDGRKRRN